MKLCYLPAIWPDVLWNHRVVTPLNWMDPRLRGTTAHHPFGLSSFGNPNWRRQRFTWDADDFIFGDSGGYSVATRQECFDPRDVLGWQLAMCSVGAVLDDPPWVDWSR